jgi:hypothetical protein
MASRHHAARSRDVPRPAWCHAPHRERRLAAGRRDAGAVRPHRHRTGCCPPWAHVALAWVTVALAEPPNRRPADLASAGALASDHAALVHLASPSGPSSSACSDQLGRPALPGESGVPASSWVVPLPPLPGPPVPRPVWALASAPALALAWRRAWGPRCPAWPVPPPPRPPWRPGPRSWPLRPGPAAVWPPPSWHLRRLARQTWRHRASGKCPAACGQPAAPLWRTPISRTHPCPSTWRVLLYL